MFELNLQAGNRFFDKTGTLYAVLAKEAEQYFILVLSERECAFVVTDTLYLDGLREKQLTYTFGAKVLTDDFDEAYRTYRQHVVSRSAELELERQLKVKTREKRMKIRR